MIIDHENEHRSWLLTGNHGKPHITFDIIDDLFIRPIPKSVSIQYIEGRNPGNLYTPFNKVCSPFSNTKRRDTLVSRVVTGGRAADLLERRIVSVL